MQEQGQRIEPPSLSMPVKFTDPVSDHFPESSPSAGAAHGIGGEAHGKQAEQHQGRTVQRIADGDGHTGSHHGRSQAADGIPHGTLALANGHDHLIEKTDAKLRSQSIQDGAHQQGAEQAMAPRASMPYRWRVKTMSLRLRNALIFSMFVSFLFKEMTVHAKKETPDDAPFVRSPRTGNNEDIIPISSFPVKNSPFPLYNRTLSLPSPRRG